MRFIDLLELPGAPLVYDVASFPWTFSTVSITKGVFQREGVKTVLDVGSGTGSAALFLGREFSVTSVEPSPQMRKLASAKGVESINGQAENLPIELGLYDAVMAAFLLRHLQPEQLSTVLSQLDAHVRPGGLLVLSDLLLPVIGPPAGQRQILGVFTLYNPHSLSEEVVKRGYTLQESYFLPLTMTLVFKKLA